MFDFGGAMNIEIKNLVKYIKHNSIKSSDEIIGMLIRSKKKINLVIIIDFLMTKLMNINTWAILEKKNINY